MKRILFMLVGMVSLLLAFFACTDGMSELQSGTLNQIVMTAPDFEAEDGSRTNVKITNAGAEFSWADNDTVGIFPTEGAQVSFPMASGAGTKTASFTGGGWALKDGVTYAAYYPFIGKFYLDKNAIPVDYTHQKQNGDASTVHISASDYMTAIPAAPENGSVNFVFRHLGALVQLKLTIPEPTTVYAVSLVAEDDAFITYGEMDVMAANASIAPVSTNNEITLSVENVTTTEANQTVTFYLMLPPADLSGKSLKAVVYTEKGNLDIALESKNFEAGKAYALGEIGDEIVDEESYDAVIKENTEMIDETFASYVTGTVNTSTIVMSASIPEELLPEIGEILLCGVEDEKFPYGFAGKVTQIKEEADGYVIETEQPELGEIFESINVEGEMPLEVIPQTESRGLELILDKESDEFKLTAEKYSDEAGFQGLSLDLTLDMEPSSNSSSDSSGNIDASFSGVNQITLGGDLGFKCAYKIVENVEGKEDCFDLNLDILSKLGLDVELGVEGKLGTDFELAKLEFAPFKVKFLNCFKKNKDNESRVAPAVVVKCIVAILDPKLILSYKMEASGKIGLNSGFECSNITNIYTKDKQLNIGTNKGTPVNWFSKINMEGKLQTGLNLKFTMKPRWRSGKEDNMLELEAFTGPQINATAETGYGSENNVCFDIVPWNNSLSGQVTIYSVMNNDIKFSASCEKEFPLGKQTRWLWPHYENLKANFNPANEKNIAVSALLKDTTIIPLKVGFALYDSDGNRLMNTDYLEYQIPAENGYSLQDEFVEVDDTKIYYVKPTVELLESTIDYEPTVKVKELDSLRDALIRLYRSTNGDNWTRNDNWCSNLPVEEWYGVSEYEGRYTLDLGNNNLTGKIEQMFPKEIESLFCYDNKITLIDISGSSELKDFIADNNSIKTLNVSGCKSLLGQFSLNSNPIETLDVSDCTNLRDIILDDLSSSSFKITGNSFEELWVSSGQLKVLDTSECTALVRLECGNNQLTSLNVSGCISLERLDCVNNQLTSLNVLGCISLERLLCHDNQLTELNILGCQALDMIEFGNNPLELLNISKCTQLKNITIVEINSPLLKIIGNSIEELNVWSDQLRSLDVSECTALQILNCGGLQLTSLNASGCKALKELDCSNNQLEDLNVLGCIALESLECQWNQLTSLNVSGCTALESLECQGNQLTSLNVSGCTALKVLNCERNQLANLNASRCRYLESLECKKNQLTSLDVSGCAVLGSLDCSENQLNNLNVSGCKLLSHIDCSINPLKKLYVSNCENLGSLNFVAINTKSLDIIGGNFIQSVTVTESHLKTLDLSGCKNLSDLTCNSLDLEILDILDCKNIYNLNIRNLRNESFKVIGNRQETLHITESRLTSIDVSLCPNLVILSLTKNSASSLEFLRSSTDFELIADSCQFTSLDFKGKYLVFRNHDASSLKVIGDDLVTLLISEQQLKSLDVSECSGLEVLNCSYNQLEDLNVSECASLKTLDCSNNQLEDLNVSKCTNLQKLLCSKNKITREITSWFSRLERFGHDVRYRYWTVKDENGNSITMHEDNGVGWWYPGEPGKGKHEP